MRKVSASIARGGGICLQDNTAFHVRRQAEAALALATSRTGKLGGWSREARDPNVLRRELEQLARNTLVVVARLEADRGA